MKRSFEHEGDFTGAFSIEKSALVMMREGPNASPEEKALVPIVNRLRDVKQSINALELPELYDIEHELQMIEGTIFKAIGKYRTNRYISQAGGNKDVAFQNFQRDMKKHQEMHGEGS